MAALQNVYSVKSHFITSSLHPSLSLSVSPSICLSLSPSVLQVYRCEVTNHLHAHAGKKRKDTSCSRRRSVRQETLHLCLLSSCRALSLFFPFSPLFHLHFLIKTTPPSLSHSLLHHLKVSHSRQGEVTVQRRRRRRMVSAIQSRVLSSTQICIVSTVHNPPSTFPNRLTSPRRGGPTSSL